MSNKRSLPLTRLHTIDLIRGISLISMIIYHFLFDLKHIFNIDIKWFGNYKTYIWQQSICITFIFIAGISFTFSKKNVLRGIGIFLMGIFFSLITYLIIPEQIIVFGILHFIGIACIITVVMSPLFKRIPPFIGFALCLLLFLLTKQINEGYIGFLDIPLYRLPRSIYQTNVMAIIGFPNDTFSSSDYFPILPWIFLYWCGMFFWSCISTKVKRAPIFRIKIPIINFLGRHCLIMYLIHQPISYFTIHFFLKNIVGQ